MYRKFLLPIVILTLLSCGGKEDPKPKIKGCMDELSLNYNEDATIDDGSCTFPADKLAGEWAVTENVKYFNGTTFSTTTLPTVTYNATIAAAKTKIAITTDRITTPVYIYTGDLTVNWVDGTLEGIGTVAGEIEDEDHFDVSYTYGTPSGVHTVKLTYVRIV